MREKDLGIMTGWRGKLRAAVLTTWLLAALLIALWIVIEATF